MPGSVRIDDADRAINNRSGVRHVGCNSVSSSQHGDLVVMANKKLAAIKYHLQTNSCRYIADQLPSTCIGRHSP